MNSERIKQIQEKTAHPNSTSVQQALMQVWHESICDIELENKELRQENKNLRDELHALKQKK